MDIILRAEAKARGLRHYFTGKPCKYGHVSMRFASTGNCIGCDKEASNVSRKKELYEANREAFLKRKKERRKEKRDSILAYDRKYHRDNRDAILARMKKYQKENVHIFRTKDAKRRAAKLNATPAWLTQQDHDAMAMMYEVSVRIERCTGIKHHVDHVIPLQGKTVCGLHVPWNMSVLPAAINLSKGARI